MPSNPRVDDPQRVLLQGCDWNVYEGVLHALEGRHARITYSQGALEIMTVSAWHEICKRLLANLIDAIIEHRELDANPVGNTTWRSRAAQRGLEADDCWYLTHAAQVKAKKEIDLAIDPPPDLVLEIEISTSALDRMAIYGQLGVPEVWRCDGTALRFSLLRRDGTYEEAAASQALPGIRATDLIPFLSMRKSELHSTVLRAFRKWLSEH